MSDREWLDSVKPPPPPPELGALLDEELARLTPVVPRRPWRDLVRVVAAGVAIASLLLVIMRVRRDVAELPVLWLASMALGWLAGFVVPVYLALVPAPGQMTPRWRAAGVGGALSAVFFVASGLCISPHGPSSFVGAGGIGGVLGGHQCLEVGVATAVVPVVLAAIAVRGTFPVGSRWAAAGLGAAGGALGGLLLHFHCAMTDRWHVGLMHGLVVAVAGALSALIVPRATDAVFRHRA